MARGVEIAIDRQRIMIRRILYIQFTDPAAYPPIEHSSILLAKRGWEVLLLGAGTTGQRMFQLPRHDRLRVKTMRLVGVGWRQKLQYVFFFFWALYWTWRWKPQWLYASDALVCPVVWWIRKILSVKVVYHEHDSPDLNIARTWFMKKVLNYRKKVANDFELCVLPQHTRVLQFIETTQRSGPTVCVWNCPRLDEIQNVNSSGNTGLVAYYHGNVSSDLLPGNLIVAASRFKGIIRVQAAGYEAPGSQGYLQRLTTLATNHGMDKGLEYLGAMPRKQLLCCASKANVGLSLNSKHSNNYNLRHLVGASNKLFDYMACGLPVLVSDLPEWVSAFVEPGYGRACDPDDPDSIEAELRWFLDHPQERREMGRKCQNKIREDWNYETMFAGVLSALERHRNN
jgi:glycosyltransferase involved in cell wall biosynthesis